MFERFDERSRKVVVLAQDEARAFGHTHIGTEHLLLGLVRDGEGLAARVLESLDVTVEAVRGQIARIVGRGDETVGGQIPFTPRAKRALELSLREALDLGHGHIGTEHILLGLVREDEGVAARILLDLGAGPDAVRAEVVRHLRASGAEAGRVGPSPSSTTMHGPPAPVEQRRHGLPAPANVGPALGAALFALAFALGLLAGWLIWA